MSLRHLQSFSSNSPRKGMSNTLNPPSGRCRLSLDRGDLWGLRESSCHWRDIFGPNPRNTNPPSLGLDFTRAAEKRAVVTYTISVGQDYEDDSNVQEATLVLGQDLVKLGLGAVVWDCGKVLAAFLGRHCHLVSGKRVLDLGTGTGIAGLAAAQCGAKEVILTDRPTLEPLVRSNVEHNSGGFPDARVRFEPLEWGAELGSREALSSSDEPFDIVLSSDCLYDPATFPAFRTTLRSVCHPRTVCLVAYKRRLDSRERTIFEQLEVDFDLQVIQTHHHEPRLTPSDVTSPSITDGCHETLRGVYLIVGVLHGCH